MYGTSNNKCHVNQPQMFCIARDYNKFEKQKYCRTNSMWVKYWTTVTNKTAPNGFEFEHFA